MPSQILRNFLSLHEMGRFHPSTRVIHFFIYSYCRPCFSLYYFLLFAGFLGPSSIHDAPYIALKIIYIRGEVSLLLRSYKLTALDTHEHGALLLLLTYSSGRAQSDLHKFMLKAYTLGL